MNRLSVAGFTNLGYRLHSRAFEPIAADMSGKTVVVTGASDGLGKETTRSLARLGARVIGVGRNPVRLAALESEVTGDVVAIQADLSLMTDVRDLAHHLLATEPHIDVLVNNVGVLLPERTVTEEGLETTLATNLAGHFLLTNLLLPRLIQSSPRGSSTSAPAGCTPSESAPMICNTSATRTAAPRRMPVPNGVR